MSLVTNGSSRTTPGRFVLCYGRDLPQSEIQPFCAVKLTSAKDPPPLVNCVRSMQPPSVDEAADCIRCSDGNAQTGNVEHTGVSHRCVEIRSNWMLRSAPWRNSSCGLLDGSRKAVVATDKLCGMTNVRGVKQRARLLINRA